MNEVIHRDHRKFRARLGRVVFGILTLIVAVLVAPRIYGSILRLELESRDVDRMMKAFHASEPVGPRYESLLARNLELCVALERIANDLEKEILYDISIDQDYSKELAEAIEESIAANPKESLLVLSSYARNGETAVRRALAIITIREQYPTKFSVFFANRNLHSPEPMLAKLSRLILKDEYVPGPLEERLAPRYIQMLIS